MCYTVTFCSQIVINAIQKKFWASNICCSWKVKKQDFSKELVTEVYDTDFESECLKLYN